MRGWFVTGALTLSSTAGAQVTGTVVDDATGDPIAGALVTLQATTTRATADAAGGFTLPDLTGSDLVLVGAGRGWFNGSALVDAPASAVEIRLQAVPDGGDAPLLAPSSCQPCHPRVVAEWEDSPMAHAAENTWVYDLYDGSGTPGGLGGFVYTRDSVHAASNPESECRACHQPDLWFEEPFTGLDRAEPSHGVSCEVCHQIADVDLSRPSFPGLYPGVVTLTPPGSGPTVQYGVLGDVDYDEEPMRAAYQPLLVAGVCASCHEDRNDPDGDGDFEEADGVSSEPTWTEWLASPYADPTSDRYATCAACHLPATTQGAACSLVDYERPEGRIRSHEIRGTSPEYLEEALTLRMQTAIDGDDLVVTTTIENDRTGHHVPTGVTIRNVILLVEAVDLSSGEALVHAGREVLPDLAGVGDPAQGYFAGLPGRLYAKIPHDASGAGPVFFTDATGLTSDNRIPALGTDEGTWRFALPRRDAVVSVRARVIYRRAFRDLVDAKGWTTDGHGDPLQDLAPPHFGHLMAEAEEVVHVEGGCGCTATGAGAAPLQVLGLALIGGARRRRPARTEGRSR